MDDQEYLKVPRERDTTDVGTATEVSTTSGDTTASDTTASDTPSLREEQAPGGLLNVWHFEIECDDMRPEISRLEVKVQGAIGELRDEIRHNQSWWRSVGVVTISFAATIAALTLHSYQPDTLV